MKPENQKTSISFWKVLRNDFWEGGLYAYIPLIIALILAAPAPIGIIDEKYEYSLSMLLAGTTFLLLLNLVRKSAFPGWKKTAHWYIEFLMKIIFLALTTWYWLNAIRSFLALL